MYLKRPRIIIIISESLITLSFLYGDLVLLTTHIETDDSNQYITFLKIFKLVSLMESFGIRIRVVYKSKTITSINQLKFVSNCCYNDVGTIYSDGVSNCILCGSETIVVLGA